MSKKIPGVKRQTQQQVFQTIKKKANVQRIAVTTVQMSIREQLRMRSAMQRQARALRRGGLIQDLRDKSEDIQARVIRKVKQIRQEPRQQEVKQEPQRVEQKSIQNLSEKYQGSQFIRATQYVGQKPEQIDVGEKYQGSQFIRATQYVGQKEEQEEVVSKKTGVAELLKRYRESPFIKKGRSTQNKLSLKKVRGVQKKGDVVVYMKKPLAKVLQEYQKSQTGEVNIYGVYRKKQQAAKESVEQNEPVAQGEQQLQIPVARNIEEPQRQIDQLQALSQVLDQRQFQIRSDVDLIQLYEQRREMLEYYGFEQQKSKPQQVVYRLRGAQVLVSRQYDLEMHEGVEEQSEQLKQFTSEMIRHGYIGRKSVLSEVLMDAIKTYAPQGVNIQNIRRGFKKWIVEGEQNVGFQMLNRVTMYIPPLFSKITGRDIEQPRYIPGQYIKKYMAGFGDDMNMIAEQFDIININRQRLSRYIAIVAMIQVTTSDLSDIVSINKQIVKHIEDQRMQASVLNLFQDYLKRYIGTHSTYNRINKIYFQQCQPTTIEVMSAFKNGSVFIERMLAGRGALNQEFDLESMIQPFPLRMGGQGAIAGQLYLIDYLIMIMIPVKVGLVDQSYTNLVQFMQAHGCSPIMFLILFRQIQLFIAIIVRQIAYDRNITPAKVVFMQTLRRLFCIKNTTAATYQSDIIVLNEMPVRAGDYRTQQAQLFLQIFRDILPDFMDQVRQTMNANRVMGELGAQTGVMRTEMVGGLQTAPGVYQFSYQSHGSLKQREIVQRFSKQMKWTQGLQNDQIINYRLQLDAAVSDRQSMTEIVMRNISQIYQVVNANVRDGGIYIRKRNYIVYVTINMGVIIPDEDVDDDFAIKALRNRIVVIKVVFSDYGQTIYRLISIKVQQTDQVNRPVHNYKIHQDNYRQQQFDEGDSIFELLNHELDPQTMIKQVIDRVQQSVDDIVPDQEKVRVHANYISFVGFPDRPVQDIENIPVGRFSVIRNQTHTDYRYRMLQKQGWLQKAVKLYNQLMNKDQFTDICLTLNLVYTLYNQNMSVGDMNQLRYKCMQMSQDQMSIQKFIQLMGTRPMLFIIAQSNQIQLYNQQQGALQTVSQFMNAQSVSMFVIQINTGGQNAHMTPTTPKLIREYVSQVASSSIKRSKINKGQIHEDQIVYTMQCGYEVQNPTNKHIQQQQDIGKNIICFDFQTLSAKNIQMAPYMFGYYGYIGGELFQGAITNDPQFIMYEVKSFIRFLFRGRDDQSTPLYIYAHNGSRFDWVILFYSLLQMYPHLSYTGTPTDLKSIQIPQIQVSFRDFCLIVPGSLQQIAKAFNTVQKKQQDVDIQNIAFFSQIPREHLYKIKQYCIQDCRTLYECVTKYCKQIYNILIDQEVGARGIKYPQYRVVNPRTSSQLAERIFTSKFMYQGGCIGGNRVKQIDDIQKSAYYGGVTQVFRHGIVKNVQYIDVNSLYPAAMCRVVVSQMSATNRDIRVYDKPIVLAKLNTAFLKPQNVYLVSQFQMKDDTIGFMAVRSQTGGLVYPMVHEQPTWRCGSQIMALLQYELLQFVQITQVLAYTIMQKQDLFQGYIEHFYKQKSKPDITPVRQTLNKSLLNQLYGQMGQKQFGSRCVVSGSLFNTDPAVFKRRVIADVNAAYLQRVCSHQKIKTQQQKEQLRQANRFVQTSQQVISQKNIHTQYMPQIKYIRPLDDNKQFVECVYEPVVGDLNYIGSLKRIAMHVTAQARSIMIKAFGALYRKLGRNAVKHIYYMDTDSYFMSEQAYDVLREAQMIHQSDLGQFKDQVPDHKITQAVFLAPKVYYYETDDGQFKGKFQGLSKNIITKQLYLDAVDQHKVAQVGQQVWKRQFDQIMIQVIPKRVATWTRRYVNSDGSTRYYENQRQYIDHHRQHRLVSEDLERFKYIKCKQF